MNGNGYMKSISYLIIFLLSVLNVSPAYTEMTTSIPVLVYHEIVTTDDREPNEVVIKLDKFKEQMDFLAEQGYSTLSMDELVEFMKGKKSVPEKSIVLTFDDGWKNVLNAVPVLEQYNFKASFWIIAGDWFGPDYMDWAQVKELDRHPNFEVESHTVTHPWNKDSNLLTWLDGKPLGKGIKDVKYEIYESKKILEGQLNRPVKYLAWPCGWYNERLIKIAKKAGYQALLTTWQEPSRRGDDIYQVKRLYVDGSCSMEIFKRILAEGKPYNCNEKNISITAPVFKEK